MTAALLRYWVRPPFFNPQTQTERDSESKADPETISGFDNWNDIPLGVIHFLERVGPGMEQELTKSDASQVSPQGVVYVLCIKTAQHFGSNPHTHFQRLPPGLLCFGLDFRLDVVDDTQVYSSDDFPPCSSRIGVHRVRAY